MWYAGSSLLANPLPGWDVGKNVDLSGQINYINGIMYTAFNWMMISAASLMLVYILLLSVIQVIFGWVYSALHLDALFIQQTWRQENSNGRDLER